MFYDKVYYIFVRTLIKKLSQKKKEKKIHWITMERITRQLQAPPRHRPHLRGDSRIWRTSRLQRIWRWKWFLQKRQHEMGVNPTKPTQIKRILRTFSHRKKSVRWGTTTYIGVNTMGHASPINQGSTGVPTGNTRDTLSFTTLAMTLMDRKLNQATLFGIA